MWFCGEYTWTVDLMCFNVSGCNLHRKTLCKEMFGLTVSSLKKWRPICNYMLQLCDLNPVHPVPLCSSYACIAIFTLVCCVITLLWKWFVKMISTLADFAIFWDIISQIQRTRKKILYQLENRCRIDLHIWFQFVDTMQLCRC